MIKLACILAIVAKILKNYAPRKRLYQSHVKDCAANLPALVTAIILASTTVIVVRILRNHVIFKPEPFQNEKRSFRFFALLQNLRNKLLIVNEQQE